MEIHEKKKKITKQKRKYEDIWKVEKSKKVIRDKVYKVSKRKIQ